MWAPAHACSGQGSETLPRERTCRAGLGGALYPLHHPLSLFPPSCPPGVHLWVLPCSWDSMPCPLSAVPCFVLHPQLGGAFLKVVPPPICPWRRLGRSCCPRHTLRPPRRFGPLNGPTAAPAPPGTWGHLAVSPRPQRSPYPPPHRLCQEPSQGCPHPVSDHFSFLQAGWCPCTPKTCDPTPRHLL